MISLYFVVLLAIFNDQPTVIPAPLVYDSPEACVDALNRLDQDRLKVLVEEKDGQFVGVFCDKFLHIEITTDQTCESCHKG